jgi:hypothetical protein
MIAITLVHVAILTNFAYSHVASRHFGFNVPKPAPAAACFVVDNNGEGHLREDFLSPPIQKVILQDSLCEKCGLGPVPTCDDCVRIAQPATPIDEETAALRNKARNFSSSIDWISKRNDLHSQKLEAPKRENWTKRFAVQWDEDGGFTFGGKYYPKPDINSTCNGCGVRGSGLDLGFEINR